MEVKICKRQLDEAGRLVLPYDTRNALGIKPGDTLRLSYEDGKIILTKNKSDASGGSCVIAFGKIYVAEKNNDK